MRKIFGKGRRPPHRLLKGSIVLVLLSSGLLHSARPAVAGEGSPTPKIKHGGSGENEEPLNADDLPAAKPGGHGEAPAKSEKTEKVEKKEYALGAPIEGFDINVLRSGRRLGELRYTMDGVMGTAIAEEPWIVHLSLSVEFGRESGMAEAEKKDAILRTNLGELLGQHKTQELMTIPGKMKLREEIIALLNKQLETARVRQVYFTDFRLLRSS